jgi:hypothetical protein
MFGMVLFIVSDSSVAVQSFQLPRSCDCSFVEVDLVLALNACATAKQNKDASDNEIQQLVFV